MFDNIFDTTDTVAVFQKEQQEAERIRQAKEAKAKLPIPSKNIGIFHVTDSSAGHGDSFVGLSNDAKLYVFFSKSVSRFEYVLRDGPALDENKNPLFVYKVDAAKLKTGKYNEEAQPDPNGRQLIKLSYNSARSSGLPLYARKGYSKDLLSSNPNYHYDPLPAASLVINENT